MSNDDSIAVAIDRFASYEIHWYCEPPEFESSLQVIEGTFEMGWPVTIRRIYSWRGVDGGTRIIQRHEPPKTLKAKQVKPQPYDVPVISTTAFGPLAGDDD